MNEKRQKFVRIAEARVNRHINLMRLIGNLSNKNAYQYDDQDVDKIFNAIQNEIDKAKAKFEFSNEQKDKRFKLEE